MNVAATFAADTQPFELVEPADGPFDNPTRLAQPAAVYDPAMGDHGLDVSPPQFRLVRPGVVRPVRLGARRSEARPSALTLEGRDGVDERKELGDVMIIRSSERDHQRDALRFGEDVVLAARAAAIGRVGPRLDPLLAPARWSCRSPRGTSRSCPPGVTR